MKDIESDKSYSQYNIYLTESEKISNSAVVNLASAHLNQVLSTRQSITIADIGCFNGSMLAQLHSQSSLEDRRKMILYGYDRDVKALSDGRKRYPFINFQYLNLPDTPIPKSFDLLISSNLLHEIYSPHLPNYGAAEDAVLNALQKIASATKKSGTLIILDGVKPDSSAESVKVRVFRPITNENLRTLKESDYIIPFNYRRVKRNMIELTLRDLGIYLTKYKYLNEAFWDIEKKQVYQFFTLEEWLNYLNQFGFSTLEAHLKYPDPECGIKIVEPLLQLPALRILIKAVKR